MGSTRRPVQPAHSSRPLSPGRPAWSEPAATGAPRTDEGAAGRRGGRGRRRHRHVVRRAGPAAGGHAGHDPPGGDDERGGEHAGTADRLEHRDPVGDPRRRPVGEPPQRQPAQSEGDPEAAAGLGQCGELALQRLPGPPEQRLHRRHSHPFVLGELLGRPAGALPELQHPLMPVGEPAEGLDDHRGVDLAQDELVDVAAVDIDERQGYVVDRRQPRATTEDVGADVPGDDREPRVEPPLAGEAGQGPPGLRERLLHRVLRLVGLVQPAQAEMEEPTVVPVVELLERGPVAALAAFDEITVAGEVDRPVETSRSLPLLRRFG